MQIIEHGGGRPKIQTVALEYDPMRVWFDARTEMLIERGDELRNVAREVRRRWSLDKASARRVVAYWFALGERAAKRKLGRPWRKKERSTRADRRYLEGIVKSKARRPRSRPRPPAGS